VNEPALPWDAAVERTDGIMRSSVLRLSRVNDDPKAVLMGSGIDSAVVAGAIKKSTGRVTIVTQAMPGAMNEAPGATRTARGLEATHHVTPYESARVSLVDELRRFVLITEAPAFWAQLAAPMLALSRSTQDLAHTFFLGIMSDNLMEYGSRPASFRRTLHRGKELVRTSMTLSGSHCNRSYFRMRAGLVRASALDRNIAYSRKNLLADESANGLAQLYANQWLNVRTTSKLVQFHGGEALLPYLDLDVVRHFMAMAYLHRHDKKVLLALLRRYMPEEYAPVRKTGFCANVIRWHHESNCLGEALDLLTEQRTRWRGIYDAASADKLVQKFRRGPVGDGRACESLYQWLLFELFCRQFLDAQPARPAPAIESPGRRDLAALDPLRATARGRQDVA
jgi:asparagine synthetase B (glutamine-hydrolysing)